MSGASARAQAYESASSALEIDPANPRAYAVLAILQLADGHHEAAIASARKAVSVAPGHAEAYLDLGFVLACSGESQQAVQVIDTALRLSPKPTPDALLYGGVVHFIAGDYDRSIQMISRASENRDNTDPAWTFLAAAYAWQGREEEAAKTIASLLETYPNSSVEYYRLYYAYLRRPEDLEKLLNGLRMAGLPEWPFGFDPERGHRLEHASLVDIAFSKTWTGKYHNGVPFVQEINEDGDVAYRSAVSFRTGKATVQEDKLCERFEGSALNSELCGYVLRNPGGSKDTKDEFIVVMPNSLRYFTVDS